MYIFLKENNSTNAVKGKINLSANYLIQLLYNIIQNNQHYSVLYKHLNNT